MLGRRPRSGGCPDNDQMKRKRTSVVALTLLTITIVVCSGLWVATQMRTHIASAFAGLCEHVRRLHQAVLWTASLLIAGSIAAVSLYRRWGIREATAEQENRCTGRGTLGLLTRWIRRSQRSPFARGYLLHELSDLAVQLISAREATRRTDARALFRTGEWTTDPIVQSLLCRRDEELTGQQFERQFEHTLSFLERFSEEV